VLEPVFGESGAIVAQFFVILVFVLILTGVCYWLFRRYYGTALPTGGRSRVPRLGVVDSLSIDHRHRLVLIRRDNVEHLLLIGKTTDLVVEPSIVRSLPAGARPRQGQAPREQPQQRATAPNPQPTSTPPAAPSQSQAPQASQAPARPAIPQPESTGISEPIPFPQNRRPPARSAPQPAEPARGDKVAGETVEQRRVNTRETPATPPPVSVVGGRGASVASASAHFEEPAHPTRVEPAFSLANALDEIADEPIAAMDAPEPAHPEPERAVSPMPTTKPDNAIGGDDRPAQTGASDADDALPIAADHDAGQPIENQGESDNEDRAAAVSSLEQEMARLLGQITAKGDG
jgi:flagellar protein FliO/FliZ